MTETRRIIFLTYEGAQLLDLTGPSAVFTAAMQLDPAASYQILAASPGGGLVTHSCGIAVNTSAIADLSFMPSDTVLVIGANEKPLMRVVTNAELLDGISSAAAKSERYGSICTGAFIVGAAGLLDGRQAATHWAARERLQEMFKTALISEDMLYVPDGNLWTSAGVTAGIDMALALVEADHGAALKSKIARRLVVYSHRPGKQSQFSDVLAAQTRIDRHYGGLVDWLLGRLDRPTKVSDMAAFVGMSERSFHRQFADIFSESPGKFLEHLKLEQARAFIEAGDRIKIVAAKVGFRSVSSFRTAFKRYFGLTPRHHAEMNGGL